ncbi:MAG: cysteine desulfurase NifS [Clostridia bacterium]
MKLSTKGRYGLKAMVDLAVNYGNGLLSISSLAHSQGISEAYLERILTKLRVGGFIVSSRGSLGGYELKLAPKDVSVGGILKCLEGSTTLVDCVSKSEKRYCENACSCSARPLWLKLQNRIDEVLETTTLRDMADDYITQTERIKSDYMKKIYLDNAATTAPSRAVIDAIMPYLTDYYGNPSSVHKFGMEAKRGLDKARESVAKALSSNTDEIIFTGGGTEADNMAIFGVAKQYSKKGKHIITTAVEHHAVLHSCAELEKQGFKVTYLPVDEFGLVTALDVENAITDETILVTIMFANNEVGSIFPIEEIGSVCKKHGVIFHTDAVQAVGHLKIDVNAMNIDLLSMSAHKFHGLKGVGALYVKKGIIVPPFIVGGAQERRKRAGTENVPGIVALGVALTEAVSNIEEKAARISRLRDRLIDGIFKNINDVKLNGHPTMRLPGNANVSIKYIEGESILLMLDLKGIAASSGSACTSGSLDPSHVLLAMGLNHETAHGSVRLTLSDETTVEDIDYTVQVLKETAERLRAMSPLYKPTEQKCNLGINCACDKE